MSALAGFRAARVQRRRDAVVAGLLTGGAVAAGFVAAQGPGGLRVAATAAGIACLGTAWRARPRRDPDRWLRGAAGEIATARALDRLPARRWVVLHDRAVPGSRANLDHLVIGPSGVWVVDTKTTRATVRAGWRTVRFGERRLDPAAILWESKIVADRLGVPVRPLIAVHGRGLRRRGGRSGGVRVVPAARVNRPIRWGRRRMDPVEVAEALRQAERVFRPAAVRSGPRTVRRG
jgi:hypothetical protein